MTSDMSYGKNESKFEPREKNRKEKSFLFQSLRIDSFLKKCKPGRGLHCFIRGGGEEVKVEVGK